MDRPLDLAVLLHSARAVDCKFLDSGQAVTLRASRHWTVFASEIATIKPVKQGKHGAIPYPFGSIESTRLDALARSIGASPAAPSSTPTARSTLATTPVPAPFY